MHELKAGEEVNTNGSPYRARRARRVDRQGQLATTNCGPVLVWEGRPSSRLGRVPLQDYGGVKLLLIPLAIIAFVLFLLILGAIGLAISFAVLYVLGGVRRLVTGGRGRRRGSSG